MWLQGVPRAVSLPRWLISQQLAEGMIVAKAVHRFSQAGSRGSGDSLKAAVMSKRDVLWLIDGSVAPLGFTGCANNGAELDKEGAIIRLHLKRCCKRALAKSFSV